MNSVPSFGRTSALLRASDKFPGGTQPRTTSYQCRYDNWAAAWDFQQFDILTCVDPGKRLQPPFKLRNSKWCSVSSLTTIEYSSDWQRLWSDCAYAQADLRVGWSHIPHCWKSHALTHIITSYRRWYVTVIRSDVPAWNFRRYQRENSKTVVLTWSQLRMIPSNLTHGSNARVLLFN